MLFDTHLHLIYPKRLRYPWLNDVPVLNKPYHYDDYTQDAARLGIVGSMHMEVDVDAADIKAETDLVKGLQTRPDSLIKGAISACRPEGDDFASFLEWASDQTIIKGFRRVLHVVPDEVSRHAGFRTNINRLADTRFSYDICCRADQLYDAIDLVDACPNVRFVLDHCGVPDIARRAFDPWASAIIELAKRPNIIAKLSGIIAYGDPKTWTISDIKPYFDHTVQSFGMNRIIWGSDSPVCFLGGGLPTWIALTYALTNSWSESEKTGLYHQNAFDFWDIKH